MKISKFLQSLLQCFFRQTASGEVFQIFYKNTFVNFGKVRPLYAIFLAFGVRFSLKISLWSVHNALILKVFLNFLLYVF